MKIYDCFLYNGESELLEIRLKELYDVVDYFVVVQGNYTFTGIPKKILDTPKDPKIRNIITNKLNLASCWITEVMQRNDIAGGLYDASADDLIIIGDADEIPSLDIVKQIIAGNVKLPCNLVQDWYSYYLNYKVSEQWQGNVVIPFGQMFLPHWEREQKSLRNQVKGGWHFSYLGGVDKIIQKLNSFSVQMWDTDYYKDPVRIAKQLASVSDVVDRNVKLEKVKIDNTYPRYIQDNQKRFASLIRSDIITAIS